MEDLSHPTARVPALIKPAHPGPNPSGARKILRRMLTWALLAGGAVLAVAAALQAPAPPPTIADPPGVFTPATGTPQVAPFSGTDHAQRRADFELWILSDAYRWQFASATSAELGGAPASFAAHLATPGLSARIRQAQGLIVVGLASFEGHSTATEELRARRRGEQMLAWLQESDTGLSRQYYTLNLGRFIGRRDASSPSSEQQRALIVIAIRHADPEVDIDSALRDGITRHLPGFRLRLSDYSLFELELRS